MPSMDAGFSGRGRDFGKGHFGPILPWHFPAATASPEQHCWVGESAGTQDDNVFTGPVKYTVSHAHLASLKPNACS